MTVETERKPFYEDEEEYQRDIQNEIEKLDKKVGWPNPNNNKGSDSVTRKDDKDDFEEQSKVDPLTLFIEAVKADIQELFIDQHNTPFAATKINEHLEIVPIKSRRFERWVSKSYYDMIGKPIKNDTLNQIIDLAESEALFSENIKDLQLRTSTDPDNHNNKNQMFYYDLTNKHWQIVKITQKGWSVEESINLPIMFTRYSNQIAQIIPNPSYPGDILDQFMNLVNVKDESNKLLLKCYIIALFIPGIPKPVLMLHGEQGSAKSTFQELIKSIVDPSSIVSLTFPRDINELVQQLSHNYIAYYDNVSFIKEWISDQICRAVTGAGFSKRQLFKDDDDIIYNFKRCIGFNGINLAATKADLLDRGIILQLDRISKDERRKVKDIFKAIEILKPQLLGYIFDILVKVLQVMNLGGIDLNLKSRMADFEEYAEVISRCIGYDEGEFIKAYYANQRLQTEAVIEGSPVATTIVRIMQGHDEWIGTATEILTDLELVAAELKINTQVKSWPKGPNSLRRRLNEVRTNLREVDITIDFDRVSDISRTRMIIIRKIPSKPSYRPKTQDSRTNRDEIMDDTDTLKDDISSYPDNIVLKDEENHVQNESMDDKDDMDDNIHTLQSREMRFFGGYWHCWCGVKGDKFAMQDHNCSGVKK